MFLGLAFALLVCGSGYCALRALGLSKDVTGLGLACSAGLAVSAILTTWAARFGVLPLGTVLLVGSGLVGLVLAILDFRALGSVRGFPSQVLATLSLLLAAVIAPALILGLGLYGLGAPLSTHDGAWHVETVDALRSGLAWAGWYPPGLHASLAAFLEAVPWVDSAGGTAGAALGLAVLAPLATFGLGCTLLRNPIAAAAGALLVSVTFQFPYFPQFWSGWPLTASTMIAVGLWAVAIEYIGRPHGRWALLAGILAGGIVLTHGTEVYTSAVGLLVILLAFWPRLSPGRLGWDLPLALGVALGVASVYLPTLFGWANAGGAVSAALEETVIGPNRAAVDLGGQLVTTVSGGLLFDLPIRVGLLAAGLWWVVRARTGRVAIGLGLAFFGLALVFSYSDAPLVQRLYALTYPWGYQYRLFMLDSILCSVVSGAGLLQVAAWLNRARLQTRRGPRRTAVRGAYVLASFAAVGTLVGMVLLVASVRTAYDTYTSDDAAAMQWLRDNAATGLVVMNDGYADAGVWAPFKAGVRILSPRSTSWAPPDAELLVRRHVLQLGASDVADAVCSLNLHYVYRGSSGTKWESRHLPSLDELRAAPDLEQVFASGDAAIFRIRVACPQ